WDYITIYKGEEAGRAVVRTPAS
ncbi:hypothetical protein CCACVL1_04048, partial [Corchorus capsularis]